MQSTESHSELLSETALTDGTGSRLIMAGAAPDTGNMGVSALCYATVTALAARLPRASMTVLDFGRGVRHEQVGVRGGEVKISRCGAKHSRRLYSPDTLWNIRLSARLGGLWNPCARRLLAADAVLDISGGDSFTDLYGQHRFDAVAYSKLIAIENGVPLILLPQTYGPFRSGGTRRVAAEIVRRSVLAVARDARSFETLRELAGGAFDPERHISGVDVAFLLEAREPRGLSGGVAALLRDPRPGPLLGFNISGLIYNDPVSARERYGLKADYASVVVRFLRRVLEQSDAKVLLIPHVLTPPGHYESDAQAANTVLGELAGLARGRVEVLAPEHDQSEVKWAIARTDWFCGTRMHATIAALSSGVPTAAIAYSGKTLGVFETCGQGEHVADPRELGTDEVVERVWSSWLARDRARASLQSRLPEVLIVADTQMDVIARHCLALAGDRAGKGRR